MLILVLDSSSVILLPLIHFVLKKSGVDIVREALIKILNVINQ